MLRQTTSLEVTSIWYRNNIQNSTWRTHRYFIDLESHLFHVDSPFIIDEISTNFRRGISMYNWRWINEDVPIGRDIQIFNFVVLSVVIATHNVLSPRISKTFLPILSLNVLELKLKWCSKEQSRIKKGFSWQSKPRYLKIRLGDWERWAFTGVFGCYWENWQVWLTNT